MDKATQQTVVDVMESVARASWEVVYGIRGPGGTATDAAGGTVGSVTEALMGCTSGLVSISGSIDALANAMERIADAFKEIAEQNRKK